MHLQIEEAGIEIYESAYTKAFQPWRKSIVKRPFSSWYIQGTNP